MPPGHRDARRAMRGVVAGLARFARGGRGVKRNADAGRDAGGKKRARSTATTTATTLVDLGALEDVVVMRRPSARNKSPYVADVRVKSDESVAIAHVPNLDSGGKLREGARALCSRQKGVTATTLGQHGTPKCELICRLLRCEERENEHLGGVWLSAHPSLVEKIALALLENGALDDRLHASPIIRDEIKTQKTLKREVTESASNSYRPDFALKHEDGSTTILEVKQVVDTDYAREFVEAQAREQSPHPAYSPSAKKGEPYARAGIFPWGKRGQKGPDGEKVVSARAIEHLRELSELASKSPDVHPAVLFICSRADAMGMRPNGAACPSFAKHLSRAQRKGVRVLVQKVRWGEGDDVGKAFDAGPLELWPALEEGDEFTMK
jgi:DNA-binding sugar fermentation-stimulating protein|tara:strand:- start:1522 stop:2664 length:1143 start_codon:yes stop_codon:yes gene_type:complete